MELGGNLLDISVQCSFIVFSNRREADAAVNTEYFPAIYGYGVKYKTALYLTRFLGQ